MDDPADDDRVHDARRPHQSACGSTDRHRDARNGGDAGVIHTEPGELIRVLNVTHVLKQWKHRLLFIVSRQATQLSRLSAARVLRRGLGEVISTGGTTSGVSSNRRGWSTAAGAAAARGPTSTRAWRASAGRSSGRPGSRRARPEHPETL